MTNFCKIWIGLSNSNDKHTWWINKISSTNFDTFTSFSFARKKQRWDPCLLCRAIKSNLKNHYTQSTQKENKIKYKNYIYDKLNISSRKKKIIASLTKVHVWLSDSIASHSSFVLFIFNPCFHIFL